MQINFQNKKKSIHPFVTWFFFNSSKREFIQSDVKREQLSTIYNYL